MIILMLGDVHGDICHLPAVVVAERPAAVIFLGDIESPVPFDELVAEIEACREQVYQAAGVRDFNLNSTQQLGEVLRVQQVQEQQVVQLPQAPLSRSLLPLRSLLPIEKGAFQLTVAEIRQCAVVHCEGWR